MLSSGNQNQFPSSLAPKEIFLRPLCSFRTLMDSILPPYLRIKGSQKGKVLPPIPKCGRKKAPSDQVTSSLFCSCRSCLFVFKFLSQSSFMLCVFSFMFLFWLISILLNLFFILKKLKNQKNKKTYVLCILVLVYLRWPLKQSFLTLYLLQLR